MNIILIKYYINIINDNNINTLILLLQIIIKYNKS